MRFDEVALLICKIIKLEKENIFKSKSSWKEIKEKQVKNKHISSHGQLKINHVSVRIKDTAKRSTSYDKNLSGHFIFEWTAYFFV